jgi:hypothetical protein
MIFKTRISAIAQPCQLIVLAAGALAHGFETAYIEVNTNSPYRDVPIPIVTCMESTYGQLKQI